MLKAAEALTAERQRQAENLCRDIRDALADLSFMEVRFDMVFDRLPECTANGIDDCYFVISTNVGEKMRPLYDVASGGELSRIMLAIKSCMASEDNIGTLVFDEIDVGISGRAAQKVAEKMAVISRSHQVISITRSSADRSDGRQSLSHRKVCRRGQDSDKDRPSERRGINRGDRKTSRRRDHN